MNYKGKLYEWCAKNGAVCKYSLVRIYGPDHDLSYVYSVTVNDKTVVGEVPKKKIKDAEHEAARNFIEQEGISFEEDVKSLSFEVDSDTCYYIDLENCANIDVSHFTWYVTFASEAAPNHIVSRASFLTSCTRSDAADVLLIIQLVDDIINNSYPKYAVVSRDRLLLTAVEVIKDRYDVDIKAVYP